MFCDTPGYSWWRKPAFADRRIKNELSCQDKDLRQAVKLDEPKKLGIDRLTWTFRHRKFTALCFVVLQQELSKYKLWWCWETGFGLSFLHELRKSCAGIWSCVEGFRRKDKRGNRTAEIQNSFLRVALNVNCFKMSNIHNSYKERDCYVRLLLLVLSNFVGRDS